jgi:transglutaminase-like putative cysteine protease
MDPTNNCLVDERYVVVAVGRDYQDVAPVRGTFRGGGERTMEVMVHLERV